MKKRLLLCIILVFAAAVCLTGCAKRNSTDIRFGTGNEGGTYYAYGMSLGEAIERDTGIAVQVISTTGSKGNLDLLERNMIELGLVQSDSLAVALEDNEDGGLTTDNTETVLRVNGSIEDVSAIAGLYTEPCQIVARADAGINKVSDLAGKKVSIGEVDSGITRNAEQILMANGLTTDRIEVNRLSFSDAADALARGEIDAFFCTAGAPTEIITRLAMKTDIKLVPLDDRCIEQLMSLYSWYEPYTIPANTYDGQEEEVNTLGVRSVLVASNTVSDELAYQITACIFDNADWLQKNLAANVAVSMEDAARTVPIGFAPGAARYYAEHGINVENIHEQTEKRASTFSVDMYQTLAIAVGILFLGGFLRKKIKALRTFCIPSPVIGGLIFAIVSLILYNLNIIEFSFDETLKNVCMVMFFTTVGFQANVNVLKSGGKDMFVFLGLVTLLIFVQNVAALGTSSLIGVDPKVGMCTGSIPMVGGHGTAGAFGPVLEGLGLPAATTLATAAATFGLVTGSLMGGPVGKHLITKNNLKPISTLDKEVLKTEEETKFSLIGYGPAAYQIAIAMGIGTVVSWLLSLTGMSFPVYIGAMIVAAVMRNLSEQTHAFKVPMKEIGDLGDICLSLYLGIAMITLQLWQLADLALPLMILLGVQTVLMFIFAYFIVFRAMGKDYDAAVLSAGTCGFGMGATPNAMANMQAITDQFGPSVKAFIIIPIIGSMMADFINSLTITFFINMI